jgi:hypothetical protein
MHGKTKYKYICADKTDKIRDYKRWKGNFHAYAFTVVLVRVRWAEISYD